MPQWSPVPTSDDNSPSSSSMIHRPNHPQYRLSWPLFLSAVALGAVFSSGITWRIAINAGVAPRSAQLGKPYLDSTTGFIHPSYFYTKEPNDYGFTLDGRSIQLGIHSFGDPSRLRHFMQKLQDGKPTVITAMGASIMAGHGASWANDMKETFPDTFMRVVDWLGNQYPDNEIKAVNGAMGGTASMFHDSCVNVLLPEDADLVIVEEAVGDVSCYQWKCNSEKLHAVERLLRKILMMKNKPAVVMLNAYGFHFSKSLFHNSPEAEVNVIASYYKLPILSVRTAMFHHMVNNEPGFRVDATGSAAAHEEADFPPQDAFYWDGVHPYGPSGARYMADLIVAWMQLGAASVNSRPFEEAEMAYVDEELPVPMLPGNVESTAAACFFSDLLEKSAIDKKGFEWKSEAPTAITVADQKWGWIASKPGSWIVFKIDTTHPEGAPEDHTSKLDIGYLASYEHMGQFEVSCVENCKCKSKILDGHWSSRFSLLQSYNLRVSEHKECMVKVEVVSKTRSGGHKVKIASLAMFI